MLSESAVLGGVGSGNSEGEAANDVVLTEGVRRWRVRYEADRGRSGLGGEASESFDRPAAWYEDRRLVVGELDVEAAGDR